MKLRLLILSFCLLLCMGLPDFCFAQKLPSLIPYRKGDLWGFSDSAGRIVVRPQFDKPGKGEGDFGFVYYENQHLIFNKYGELIINSQNDFVIDSLAEEGIELSPDPEHSVLFNRLTKEYAFCQYFSFGKGYIVGRMDENNSKGLLYGIINLKGKIVFPLENDSFDLKMAQFVSFAKDGVYSDYFTFNGDFAYKYFECRADEKVVFKGNFVIKESNGSEPGGSIYTRYGKLIVQDTFHATSISLEENGPFAIISLEDPKTGYIPIDTSGNSKGGSGPPRYCVGVIDTSGNLSLPFANTKLLWAGNYTLWKLHNSLYDIIDVRGNIIKRTAYISILDRSFEGRKFFWGMYYQDFGGIRAFLLDSNGKKLTPRHSYIILYDFWWSDGLMPVFEKHPSLLMGVINLKGKLVIPMKYYCPIVPGQDGIWNGMHHFQNGLMKVKYNNKEIYISRYNRRYYED